MKKNEVPLEFGIPSIYIQNVAPINWPALLIPGYLITIKSDVVDKRIKRKIPVLNKPGETIDF